MLDLHDYWMGRDSKFRGEWTEKIQANGAETVRRINLLIDDYISDTGNERPDTWASGWRPDGVNAHTKNAASHSTHIDALAGDVGDEERDFARWCNAHPERLVEHGLWMEDSRWCPTWVHLQTVPPGSGRSIYIPSAKPPLCGMP